MKCTIPAVLFSLAVYLLSCYNRGKIVGVNILDIAVATLIGGIISAIVTLIIEVIKNNNGFKDVAKDHSALQDQHKDLEDCVISSQKNLESRINSVGKEVTGLKQMQNEAATKHALMEQAMTREQMDISKQIDGIQALHGQMQALQWKNQQLLKQNERLEQKIQDLEQKIQLYQSHSRSAKSRGEER